MPRPALLLIALLLVLAACGGNQAATRDLVAEEATATPNPTATPTPDPSIIGTLKSWEDSPVVGRKIVLCQITDNEAHYPADCILMRLIAISDGQGGFQFFDVPPGTYLMLYDSRDADFDAGLDRWAGQTLKLGDINWLVENYFASDAGNIDITLIKGMPMDMNVVAYLAHSLGIGQSPFILAHQMDQTFSRKVFTPVFATLISDQPAQVEFEVR